MTAGGLEIVLLATALHDEAQPWRQPPPGEHCVVYRLLARSVDGRRHDLRPSGFRVAGGTVAGAVGHCNTQQMQPVWLGDARQVIEVTLLESTTAPATLLWDAP